MNATRYQDKKTKKVLIIAIVSVLVLLIAGYFTFAFVTKQAWPFQSADTTEDQVIDGINYSPPTEQEVRDSQDGKVTSGEQENAEPTGTVSIGIAYAGYDEQEGVIDIRAFTPDIIEGNGTCTATLTQGSLTVTRDSKAFVDSSSSQCEPIQIPTSEFTTGGTWNLVVRYASPTSTGSSAPMNVEVTK